MREVLISRTATRDNPYIFVFKPIIYLTYRHRYYHGIENHPDHYSNHIDELTTQSRLVRISNLLDLKPDLSIFGPI